MAMPPIVVVAELFARKGNEADRVRSEQSLLLLMEAMCAINLLHLRQRRYPKLYESGVVYRREDGTENWLDIPTRHQGGLGRLRGPGLLARRRAAQGRRQGGAVREVAARERRLQVPRARAALRARARPLRPDGERRARGSRTRRGGSA